MKEVAAFASSDQGKAFARIEQYFGRDPARFLEGEDGDDVLAHNLRAALIMALAEDVPETDDPGEAARLGGDKVREALSGSRH